MTRFFTLAIAILFATVPALAQEPAGPAGRTDNPLTSSNRDWHERIKSWVVRAAERMPEEHYAFRPTDEVRTFGQLVAHIADAQYMICAAAGGRERSGESVEKTKTAKADLVRALNDSFAYCDEVYAGMTDAKAVEPVKFFMGEWPRLTILAFNTGHNWEHYGNIVTYMRIKGLVPPSSEQTE